MKNKKMQDHLVETCNNLTKQLPDGIGGLVVLWESDGRRAENIGVLVGEEDDDYKTAMSLADLMTVNERVCTIVAYAMFQYSKKQTKTS